MIPLAEIEAARQAIRGVALRTPLVRLPDTEIHLKLENLQPIGSFKLRGAVNAIRDAPPEGVVTVSAGNMAQGVAFAARALGVPATAVVPEHAPETKLRAIERLGGRAVKVSFERWWQVMEAGAFPEVPGRFVHPFDDDAVMAGNGTIGLELLEDLPEPDAVVVPWGGGGLACGIASALRQLRPRTRVYAAEVTTAAPLSTSLAAGSPQVVAYAPSFVDGIGAKALLPRMWALGRELLDGAFAATPEEIRAAVRLLAERAHVVAEGAGAAALAVALSGRAGSGSVVCIVSGGNIQPEVLAGILQEKRPGGV